MNVHIHMYTDREKNRDRESERKIEVGDVRPPLYLGCVDIGPTRA